MAKMIKKISNSIRFSKKYKADGSRSFIDFVESFAGYADPKNYNL